MAERPQQRDAYRLILDAIERGDYRPGDRLVESELADRFGTSRTPVREALQRLETQSMLTRDGRSLIVASLDHNQMAEFYVVRTELEGLAARLAARHATPEEIKVLGEMVEEDQALLGDPQALARANRRFRPRPGWCRRSRPSRIRTPARAARARPRRSQMPNSAPPPNGRTSRTPPRSPRSRSSPSATLERSTRCSPARASTS